MEFLANYGLFLAKSLTIVIAILFLAVGLFAISSKGRKEEEGHIEVKNINDKFESLEQAIKSVVLDDEAIKAEHKAEKKHHKEEVKAQKKQAKSDELVERKKRIYVLKFYGDVKASAVSNLREEVSAVLTMADRADEVVLCLESPGGMVHGYGLAASQLQRISNKEIPLTVAVDMVAASGGYMMACIGSKIIAAPFAILGSIGVVAQLPNFHRLLKKNDVDFEMFTAGEHKRTVTMFGENTEKGRQKFSEELEDTHELFKSFVSEHRPQVNVSEVATGEIWYGARALENDLIDDIQTSDEYLMAQRDECDIYSITFAHKKSFQEKLGLAAQYSVEAVFDRIMSRLQSSRFTR